MRFLLVSHPNHCDCPVPIANRLGCTKLPHSKMKMKMKLFLFALCLLAGWA